MDVKLLFREIYSTLRDDYSLRTFFFSAFSLLASIAMGVFNLAVGIYNHTTWNIGISVYYFQVTILRVYVFVFEYLIRGYDEYTKDLKRMRMFVHYGIILIIMTFFLVWPIVSVISDASCAYTNNAITIIFALYTIYRLALAILNLLKTKNDMYNRSVRILTVLTMYGVIVSIIILENVLVLVVGNYNIGTIIFSAVTSALFWVILFYISCRTIYRGIVLRTEEDMIETEKIYERNKINKK